MKDPGYLHPIVSQLNPSREQIGPICSRGKDVVVTAGAGTGKTRTLVARFLGMLADGIPLRTIAAITFTKKAAREMRNRVREEIRNYLLNTGLTEEDKVFWREIYQGLDAARISTIHSLAGDILQQHPAEMGLDPGVELMDEGEAVRLRKLAIDAGLAWAGEDQFASRLFPIYGDWKMRRILSELLSKRIDVEDYFRNSPDKLWYSWEPHLIGPLKKFIEDPVVRAGMDGLAGLKKDGTLAKAEEAGDRLAEDLRIVIDQWEIIRNEYENPDWVQVSRAVGLLGSHLKQKGRKENWAPANPRAVIKEIQSIYRENLGNDQLDLAVDKQLANEIIPGLKRLFQFSCQWYHQARSRENKLDFDDLEEKVIRLFSEHPNALSYWREEIQMLLVDEYQDTNGRQRELINLLNGGQGKLFIVGDGKQSIYRFRGADVGVFRQEQASIRKMGEGYSLETSYRSHPQLLSDLNSLLAPVLGDRKDVAHVEPFSELKPGRASSPLLDLPYYLEAHLAVGNKNTGAGYKAAEAVASRLLELIGNALQPGSSNSVSYGDVAVLCRASSSFSDYEAAFENAGIPYMTVAGQGFYDRPEVRDVLNALRVFMDPQDDLALVGLMRSPVGGFQDQMLLDLREFQEDENLGSLFEALKRFAENSTEEGNSELTSIIGLINEFSALAGRVTTAELISRFLDRSAYAAVLSLAGQERSIGNLRKLVSDAQANAIVNISDYLNSIQDIRNVDVRESEAPFVSEGAVQIMSVHQAKGLEFPVVILGDAAKRERLTRDILMDDRFGLIPPFSNSRIEKDAAGFYSLLSGKSTAYEMALEKERQKEQAEADRLLYVAATRAQEMLIINGAVGNPTRDNKLPRLSGWLEKLSMQLGLEDWDLVVERGGKSVHKKVVERPGLKANISIYEDLVEFAFDTAKGTNSKRQGEDSLDLELWDQLENRLGSQKINIADMKPIYPASTYGSTGHALPRIVGEVVHRALELWKFPSTGESDFLTWVEKEIKWHGVYNAKAIQSGYRRVREILERFRRSELFERMDRAVVISREIPFRLPGEDGADYGVIDALFRENGQWILVEFKTDNIREGDKINWSSVDYQAQVARYLHAGERLLKERPLPVLCFLDYGGRVKIVTDRW